MNLTPFSFGKLRFRTLVLAALVVPALALTGCDSNGTDADDAPAVIAPSAFTFDSSFPEESGAPLVGAHFLNGAARVGIVTLAVGANLIVPAAATDAATDAEPFVEGGVWIWENTVPVNGTPVTFRLEGEPEGTSVDWRMYVSSTNVGGVDYDGFLLYSATTSLNGRIGDWELFYEIEGERTNVLDADFEVTSETEREITFSVPATNPNPDARGSSVEYTADGSVRTFDWNESAAGNQHLVEWNETTKAGSITATNYNGGVRSCWDTNLNDTACN